MKLCNQRLLQFSRKATRKAFFKKIVTMMERIKFQTLLKRLKKLVDRLMVEKRFGQLTVLIKSHLTAIHCEDFFTTWNILTAKF